MVATMSLQSSTEVGEVTQNTGEASSVRSVENYRYLDAKLDIIWHTSIPKDDEAAVAYFHTLMRFGSQYRPVYVQRNVASANEGEKYETLPFTFDPDTYTTTERKK